MLGGAGRYFVCDQQSTGAGTHVLRQESLCWAVPQFSGEGDTTEQLYDDGDTVVVLDDTDATVLEYTYPRR